MFAAAAIAGGCADDGASEASGTNSEAIVFVRGGDLWVVSSDLASDATRLTDTSAVEGEPAASPDGRRIAFTRKDGGRREIWVMDTSGNNARRIVSGGSNDGPAWSADGGHIFFSREVRQREHEPACSSIFAVTASGGDIRRITNSPGVLDVDPAVSADGSIAFVRVPPNRDPCAAGSYAVLTVVDASGAPTGDLGKVDAALEADLPGSPTWSADGERVAFDGCYADECAIYTANREGSDLTQIAPATQEPGWSSEPAWSPSGDRIAFARIDTVSFEPSVYVVRDDGSEEHKVVGADGGSYPAWLITPGY